MRFSVCLCVYMNVRQPLSAQDVRKYISIHLSRFPPSLLISSHGSSFLSLLARLSLSILLLRGSSRFASTSICRIRLLRETPHPSLSLSCSLSLAFRLSLLFRYIPILPRIAPSQRNGSRLTEKKSNLDFMQGGEKELNSTYVLPSVDAYIYYLPPLSPIQLPQTPSLVRTSLPGLELVGLVRE